MKTAPFTLRALPVAVLSLALGACGGGGGGGSSSGPVTSTISGTASKGVFVGAKVTAYKVNADGTKGDALNSAPVSTGADGKFQIVVTGYTGPVLLEMNSDATTQMLCDVPAGCSDESGNPIPFKSPVPFPASSPLVLKSVLPALPGGTVNAAITPFTRLAADFAEKQSGKLTRENIDKALSQVAALFELANLNGTVPADATKTLPADLDAQRYALLNAAIGKLGGGKLSGVNAVLTSLSTALASNSGQLPNHGAAAVGDDLADVLQAADDVAQSGKLSGLNDLVKNVVADRLATALATSGNTDVQPSDISGKPDLDKAKAFVASAGKLASSLRALDDPGVINGFRDKIATLSSLVDGNVMLSPAVASVMGVLADTVFERGATSVTLTPAEVQSILDRDYAGSDVQIHAQSNVRVVVNAAARTVTFNGDIRVQRVRYEWNYVGGQWVSTLVNDGPDTGFTVGGVALSYPAAGASKSYAFGILPGGSVASSDASLSFPAGSASSMSVTFPTLMTFADRQADQDGENPEQPTAFSIKLDQVSLSALKAAAAEFSQFKGSLSLSGGKRLDVINGGGQRDWPVPTKASLNGVFTNASGANRMEAGATIDLSASNPLVSPSEGFVRNNLLTYRYNAVENAAYLTAKTGSFWHNDTWFGERTVIKLKMDAYSGDCLVAEAQYYDAWLGCYGQTTVPASLDALLSSGGYGLDVLNIFVPGEGYYAPSLTGITSKSTDTLAQGRLVEGGLLSEDATHFGQGVITLNAKVRVDGATPVDLESSITARRTAVDGGEFVASFRVGNDKLTLTTPVVGGKAVYKLTNLDGVTVEASAVEQQDKVAIKLNGVEYGWIYTVNGLPVVKFADGSLKAL